MARTACQHPRSCELLFARTWDAASVVATQAALFLAAIKRWWISRGRPTRLWLAFGPGLEAPCFRYYQYPGIHRRRLQINRALRRSRRDLPPVETIAGSAMSGQRERMWVIRRQQERLQVKRLWVNRLQGNPLSVKRPLSAKLERPWCSSFQD